MYGIQNSIQFNITNKVAKTPVFRANGVTTSPADSVELSTKSKKQETNYTPYVLGGVALAGLVAALILHKKTPEKVGKDISEPLSENLQKIQENLKAIFKRNFSDTETKDFASRYSEILKIENQDDFCKKVFEELKKDYKVENKNLELIFEDSPAATSGNVMMQYTEALSRHIGIFRNNLRTKERDFSGLFHEFRHVKQFETMYRTDRERLIEIKVDALEKSNNASWQGILSDCENNREVARAEVRTQVEDAYNKIYSHLTPLNKNSEEYKMGLKYLENEANRICGFTHSLEEYKAQILEKEAYEIEEKAAEIYNLLKQ